MSPRHYQGFLQDDQHEDDSRPLKALENGSVEYPGLGRMSFDEGGTTQQPRGNEVMESESETGMFGFRIRWRKLLYGGVKRRLQYVYSKAINSNSKHKLR